MNNGKTMLMQGNQACALAAVAAGCRLFAGYPITPSSEIAEWMSEELPKVDGVFIQMEDEIASMGAVIGASIGGVKAMTATSGPGFSLKQENLGFAAGAEVPCVVVNVMRGGPSTGMPTRPSQGDVMQARWGTHGDHPAIVLAPNSVPEIYSETVRAFNLSERFRVPVVLLFDEVIGHLRETVGLPGPDELEIVERKWADPAPAAFEPYGDTADGVPPMSRPGDGHRTHITGLTHGPDGFPTQEPAEVARAMDRLLEKLDRRREEIDAAESLFTGDAEVLTVAIGISARAAERAVRTLRKEGIKAGLFRPITLWPFPEADFRQAAAKSRGVLVPEMNAGQLVHEVQRQLQGRGFQGPVQPLNRLDGEPLTPAEIEQALRKLVNHG